MAAHLSLTLAGAWGAARLEDGLSLDEVVPRETSVARFLEAQGAHFGYYNIYAVTMGNLVSYLFATALFFTMEDCYYIVKCQFS